MIKLLRKNVLINLGNKIEKAGKDSPIYLADESHCIDRKGVIVRVADQCEKFTKKDEGMEVILHVVKGGDRVLSPKLSKSYGEAEAYHLIAPENKIYAKIEC